MKVDQQQPETQGQPARDRMTRALLIPDELIRPWPCWTVEEIENLVGKLAGDRARYTLPQLVSQLQRLAVSAVNRLWVALHPAWGHDDATFRLWACDCAERALKREREVGREPDARSWGALEVARRHAMEQATNADLAEAWEAAWEAARGLVPAGKAWRAAWPASRNARAAWGAAWGAAWAAVWTAELHAWDAARQAARAAALAAGSVAKDDKSVAWGVRAARAARLSARAAECEWQLQHLMADYVLAGDRAP